MEFELGASERRELIESAERLVDLARRRAHGPSFAPTPATLIETLLEPPSEGARAVTDVFNVLESAVACGWTKSSGGDLAYIPSGGLETGSVASWLGAGLHAFTGASFEAPAFVALEESVLLWMAQLLGMADGTEGILLSGGSLANQTAIACARGLRVAGSTGVAYLSPHSHHSVGKAARLSGIPQDELQQMPVDPRGRVDVGGLRQLIARDRSIGRHPWLLAAVAGDTDTGGVDPLEELAELAREQGIWLHADAAYGGFFALTARGAARLRGIGSADSVTIDAHKGLFLPYGVGAVLVSRKGALAAAHSATGSYLRDVDPHQQLPHYFDRGPENTRPFRGMLIWLPLQLHGVRRFRDDLDRMLDLAAEAARRLRGIASIEVPRDPELSIALFRSALGDVETQRILDGLNASGRFHVSSTTLDERITIRLAFLHPRTNERHLDDLIELVEHLRLHP